MKKRTIIKVKTITESKQLKLVKLVRTLAFVSLGTQIVASYSLFTNAFETIFNILAIIIRLNIGNILDPLSIGTITIIISVIGYLLSNELKEDELRKGYKYKGRFIAIGTSALLIGLITLVLLNI
jgi:uncharacterized membrane protein